MFQGWSRKLDSEKYNLLRCFFAFLIFPLKVERVVKVLIQKLIFIERYLELKQSSFIMCETIDQLLVATTVKYFPL